MENINTLAARWSTAKQAEESGRLARLEIEALILEQADVKQKPDGSCTTDTGAFKVTVTHKTNLSLDADKWAEIRDQISPELLSVVNYKPALDPKGVKWVRENNAAQYAILSQAITAKPAKPGVRVVAVEEGK